MYLQSWTLVYVVSHRLFPDAGSRPHYQASLPDLERKRGYDAPTQKPSINQYINPKPAGTTSLYRQQYKPQVGAAPAGAPTGYPRHWGGLKDPTAGPYQALPPIGHGTSALSGILDTSKSEPQYSNVSP